MDVSYKRLWKLLIDRDMKKKDLAEKANLSNYTINKMNKGENVNTDTLVKICGALNCRIEDIMEVVPDENDAVIIIGQQLWYCLYCKNSGD